MKKFTCLLVACLLVASTLSACTGGNSLTSNLLFTYLNGKNTALNPLSSSAPATPSSTLCFATVPSPATGFCCTQTGLQSTAATLINSVATAITNFGTASANIGAVWSKISALLNATAITGTTTPSAALATATGAPLSGASGVQFQAFSTYNQTQLNSDFSAFQTAAVPCYNFYSSSIQTILCDACIETGTTAGPQPRYTTASTSTGTAVPITAASCTKWVAACQPVWNYMWKAGWFMQTAAFLQATKAGTTSTFTPSATPYYNMGMTANAIANINTALADCSGITNTTTPGTCTTTDQSTLCSSFINIAGSSDGVTPTLNGVGRSDTTYVASTTAFGRRVLTNSAMDGTVMVDTTSNALDLTTASYPIAAATATPYSTLTTTAWSTGMGGSTSGSTKSAKVLFGTLISAILAVALLN